jgi:hypothetical protein
MKNKIFKKNYIAAIFSLFLLSSCDALLDQDETDFGKGPILAQFANPVSELNIIKNEENTPVVYEFDIAYFGGRGVALDKDVTISIATSAQSDVAEGTGFEILTPTLTIPAGSTSATGSIRILTEPLVPFDFKDIVLEITDSSESISEVNTLTLTLKALGADSLAGTYEVIAGDYWRIGVNNGWSQIGATRTIEALSETTYRHPDFFGLFSGQFFFTVDADDKVKVLKTNPITGAVILQGTAPVITCEENSSSLTNVKCGESNRVERTNDRRDIIYLSYGYNTPGSGPREFYEVLRRVE